MCGSVFSILFRILAGEFKSIDIFPGFVSILEVFFFLSKEKLQIDTNRFMRATYQNIISVTIRVPL